MRHAFQRREDRLRSVQLDILYCILDALTFDRRMTRNATITLFREIKDDLNLRARYVRICRETGYRFRELPEKYGQRENKKERPDQFFHRVYARLVPLGLMQADIRRVDPAYYNVLHVWHRRHDRKLACLLPSTRPRRD